MKLTRMELYMIYNSLSQRKNDAKEFSNVIVNEYQDLMNKIDGLIKNGKDVQVVDRIWE